MIHELSILRGKVEHVERISETSGTITKGSGSISTSHRTLLRVGVTSIEFHGAPSVKNGDNITVVGRKKGEFLAYVLRNDSTGACYDKTGKIIALYIMTVVLALIFSWNLIDSSLNTKLIFALLTGVPAYLCIAYARMYSEAKNMLN